MLLSYLFWTNTKAHPPHSAVFDYDDRVVVGFKNGVDAVKIAILPGSGRGHGGRVGHGDGVLFNSSGLVEVDRGCLKKVDC